jgi:hypothetical protein
MTQDDTELVQAYFDAFPGTQVDRATKAGVGQQAVSDWEQRLAAGSSIRLKKAEVRERLRQIVAGAPEVGTVPFNAEVERVLAATDNPRLRILHLEALAAAYRAEAARVEATAAAERARAAVLAEQGAVVRATTAGTAPTAERIPTHRRAQKPPRGSDRSQHG